MAYSIPCKHCGFYEADHGENEDCLCDEGYEPSDPVAEIIADGMDPDHSSLPTEIDLRIRSSRIRHTT